MRVCVLTHTFPRFPKDVAAPFMYGVATGLAEAGNEVVVVTPFSDKFGWNTKKLAFKIVTYKYIWPDSLHKLGYSETLTNDMGLPIVMWALAPFMYFFAILKLWSIVRTEKIEIINAHWILPNGFIASVVSILTGVPVVSTLPGSDVYMVQKNILFNILGRVATWRSKWITSNSQQLILDLAKTTNMALKNKSSTIIYGVDPDKFMLDERLNVSLKKELAISKDNLVILGVGRLVAKKGFRYLVEASPKVLKKNKKVTFVVVGEGDQRKELEEFARKLGVFDDFRFPGWADYAKLKYYYSLADIFILPSVRDEKGNLDDQSVSVVEAMACSKPIVTTNFPGYKMVVQNGVNGYLTDEKNSVQIADALIKFAISKKLRTNMGRVSRKMVIDKFSWKAIAREYTNLFSNVLERKFYSQAFPVILDERQRRKKARQIIQLLKLHVGDVSKLRCLDVGCSNGAITAYLAKSLKSVVGIDVDESSIKDAKKRYGAKNVQFLQMRGEAMNFSSVYFDVVIANQIYEFVDDADKTFSEIYRVLKKGGVCFMGARNKFALIEAQYKLPFLSFIPANLADLVVRITGKGQKFIGKYKNYSELKQLVKKFKVHDYTVKILTEPKKYKFYDLAKYSSIVRFVPLDLFNVILPNYIWMLEK